MLEPYFIALSEFYRTAIILFRLFLYLWVLFQDHGAAQSHFEPEYVSSWGSLWIILSRFDGDSPLLKPSDYSSWVGQNDSNELVTVIDYSAVSPVRHSLNSYGVYGLFLQGEEEGMKLVYGTGKYDYSAGTLICVAPGQLGGKEDNGELVHLSGWAMLFHPDILQGTALEKEIKNFSFFDYRINEALHMSDEEREIIIGLFRQIQNELKFPADSMQNRIIAGFINLLLRYAQRFYNRQFVSRTILNNDIPTGETANHYIKQYIIQLAKNRLVSGKNSSEVAYSLGFDYPQHFSRTFKKITGETPTKYQSHRIKR